MQFEKLKHCNKIFQEKKSDADGKRPAIETCLEYVREKETLVVTGLDRLARSTLHLCQFADQLKSKGIELPEHQHGGRDRYTAFQHARRDQSRQRFASDIG